MEMPEDTINAGNYTPITQGLREYVRMHPVLKHTGLSDFLDNIDAIHKALEDENAELRETVFEHEISNVETTTFLDRLSDEADKREDVTLWGVRYKALPLGADGASLDIGDKVDSDEYVGGTVTAVRWDETPNSIRALIAVRPDGWDTATWHCPEDFRRRHHIEPTVEGLLREFALACEDAGNAGPEVDRLVEKYANALKLADREPLAEVEQ